MTRLRLPYPILAALLFVMWLLLTQSFSPGQVLLGAAIALFGAIAMSALRPEERGAGGRSSLARLRALARLAMLVIADIIRSNFAVASIILFPRQERVSGFVRMPLELRNRHGLAILALIITATPGTLWVEFDRRRSLLLIHVLDLVDEEDWIRLIKHRYESLLMEIFER